MFENYYCKLNEIYNFVSVSKCGCTTLKNIALRFKYDNFNEIHDFIGYEENEYLKPVSQQNKKNGKIYFAVWRDPVERFISIYEGNIKNTYVNDLSKNRIYYNIKSLEELYQLSIDELKKEPLEIDEHIRMQSQYYGIDDIDFVVKIEDLKKFLNSIGIKKYDILNKSIEHFEYSDEIKKKIKELYKNDYVFFEELKRNNKIWFKNK